MLHYHRSFRAVKCCRVILSILLIVLIVSNVAGQRRRRVEISSVMQPSRVMAPRYFRMHGRFGGGVTPRGSAEFLSPAKTKLDANQLQLVVLDEAKLRNDRPDYDAIGIRWRGDIYQLAAQDDLIYPLMKFIQRGRYIAYTIPVAGRNVRYFRQNALEPFRIVMLSGRPFMGYVAKEFMPEPLAELLEHVDLYTRTEELDADLKKRILDEVKVGSRQLAGEQVVGSYVNADFHVKYQVFLDNDNGKKVVDVGGLPLRYYWVFKQGSPARVEDVAVFKFPEEEFSLQDRAVMLFQTAAILRQFSLDNPREFNRFLSEVSPGARGREGRPSPGRGRRAPRRR